MISKTVRRVIEESDIILEVLDARVPLLTRNKKIERLIMIKNKELILVLNKSDLVPESFIKKVKEMLDWEYPAVYVSAITRKGSRALRKTIKLHAPDKSKVIVGVVGYPNTGKSSIINLLRGRHVTPTGPLPGITRGMQLVKLSRRFYLVDTPGIFSINYSDEDILRGAVLPDKIKYPERAAYLLIKTIMEKCPSALKIYSVESDDPEDFLYKLSNKYRLSLRDTSLKILRDWIFGKLRAYWI